MEKLETEVPWGTPETTVGPDDDLAGTHGTPTSDSSMIALQFLQGIDKYFIWYHDIIEMENLVHIAHWSLRERRFVQNYQLFQELHTNG